jgi:hypothetical protein
LIFPKHPPIRSDIPTLPFPFLRIAHFIYYFDLVLFWAIPPLPPLETNPTVERGWPSTPCFYSRDDLTPRNLLPLAFVPVCRIGTGSAYPIKETRADTKEWAIRAGPRSSVLSWRGDWWRWDSFLVGEDITLFRPLVNRKSSRICDGI